MNGKLAQETIVVRRRRRRCKLTHNVRCLGGPGCSSLEGFFQENGRIQWTWGQYAPQINDYSWVNLTNVLWVEQPVGTGFSIGKANATNEEDISRDFVGFFKNFEKIFSITDHKIYVTGE